MLVLTSPAGLEQFFAEVQRREGVEGPVGEDEVVQLALGFGTHIVGPPIGPV